MEEAAEHAHIERLQEALLRIRGTASSSDQSVTVEVGANGSLHDIQLSEVGLRLDPKLLVELIIGLHRLAHTEASDVMRATVEDLQAETAAEDESEPIGNDLDSPDVEPDAQPPASLEPSSPADEQPREENPPLATDPLPNEAPEPPDPSPDSRDQIHDAPPVAVARRGDPEDRMAHVIRPHEPPGDGGVYDLIGPGEDNPYATVIASPPLPRRVPSPRPTSSTSDLDASDRPVPQPVGPPWHDTTLLPDPALPPNNDYPEYDYPGYDDLEYRYSWDN
ncbi:YbaB/EbfC family nucleoid-associated protein [Nocardia salmonicida]|uniref:YbaB/EbfC family nucleoid-associated protein n=1 Tax=Nocardia salmonicida TaxID=53431 RepID=UPI0009EDA08E|nr:YbaB/EbfC family nucleoid-associated protein [Nocardia salmonicida]